MFILGTKNKFRELFYILMIDASITDKKREILNAVLQKTIDEIPKESFVLIGFFNGNDTPEWVEKEPTECTQDKKDWLKNKLANKLADKKLQERKNGTFKPMDIANALKLTLELPFGPSTKDFSRSVILFSNGTFLGESQIEKVLEVSLDLHKSRVSAIGIGNGSSDNFLRTIATKGRGIIEVIHNVLTIETKIKEFVANLRRPTISNIKFDYSPNFKIIAVIPFFNENSHLLKKAPIEIFIYFESYQWPLEGSLTHPDQVINMTYDDNEYGEQDIKKSLAILIDDSPVARPADLHKLMISRLLNTADVVKSTTANEKLVTYIGLDWDKTLAVEHKILTKHTMMLALIGDVKKGFNTMNGDITKPQNDCNVANDFYLARNMYAAEVLPSYNTCNTVGYQNSIQSSATFMRCEISNWRTKGTRRPAQITPSHSTSSRVRPLQGGDTAFNPSFSQATLATQLSNQMSEFDVRSLNDILADFMEDDNVYEMDRYLNGSSIDFSRSGGGAGFGAGRTRPSGSRPNPIIDRPEREETTNPAQTTNLPKTHTTGGQITDRIEFILSRQEEDGGWKIEESLLQILKITKEQLDEIASEHGIEPHIALVVLCMAYIKAKEHRNEYTRALKYCMNIHNVKNASKLRELVAQALMIK